MSLTQKTSITLTAATETNCDCTHTIYTQSKKLRLHSCHTLNIQAHFPANNRIETI